MTLFHPVQKICVVFSESSDRTFLLAASGPELSSIAFESGKVVSQWPLQNDPEDSEPICDKSVVVHDNNDRPLKKRKTNGHSPQPISRRASEASEASVEIVAEREKGERRRPKPTDQKLPKISHVITSNDGRNVVLVTADNKMVTVLELDSNGQLRPLSQRALPKRLCAIKLTSDEKTILAADKFGDVYAIPLLPSDDWVARKIQSEPQTTFKPSATEHTVHTKGNLEALRQQREQKHFKQKKDGPNFEHKLLLGHVSLLTDLAVAEGRVGSRRRPYIITADRDEHIRVSRGIPQAHIIETYCVGHYEFISKLCIIPWASEILIAGNGEPSLRMFHWQTGKMLQQVLISQLFESFSGKVQASDGRAMDKISVSGIWPVQLRNTFPIAELQPRGLVLVALEGMPVLLTFCLNNDRMLQCLGLQPLAGNVLDIAQIGQDPRILVSLDLIHKPYSVRDFREDSQSDGCLQSLKLVVTSETALDSDESNEVQWVDSGEVNFGNSDYLSQIEPIQNVPKTESKDQERIYSPLGEFLYGLENLRKKKGMMIEDDA